jgi:hypothetical protein
MAAVDFVEMILEENPLFEGFVSTPATGPNRLATEKAYFAGRTAQIVPGVNFKSRDDEFRGISGAVPKLLDHFEPSGAFSEYAYYDDLTWLLSLSGFVGVHTTGGPTVTDPDATTATGVNALNSPIVNVASTALFPAAGSFVMGGVNIAYTGKTATSFTGCGAHVATVGGEVIANNVPAACHKWVFSKKTGIVAPTAQIRINYADENQLWVGNGFAISQLSMSGEGELAATLLGMVVKRFAADAATVPVLTTQAVPPIRRGDLYVSFLAGGGAIADFGWQIENPIAAIRTMSILPPSNYPDTMEFDTAQAKLTGTIPKRIAAGVDLDAVMAATTFAAKARYKSPKVIGATAYPYSMWVEMPSAQYTAGTIEELKNARRFGVPDLAFEAAYDEVAGYDVRVTLCNGTPSISTFA